MASAVAGFVAGFVAHKAIDFVGSIDFLLRKEKEEVKIDADAILRSRSRGKIFQFIDTVEQPPGNLTSQKKDWDTGHLFQQFPTTRRSSSYNHKQVERNREWYLLSPKKITPIIK